MTTTASDVSRMESRFPLSSSCWLGGHVQDLLGSVCCPFAHEACAAVSFRRCRCRTCSSGTQDIPPASVVSLRQARLSCQCDAPPQPSVFWPGRLRSHRTLDVLIGLLFSYQWSLWDCLASLLASGFPRQYLNHGLVTAPERGSMSFLALFVIQGNSVPFLEISQHRPCHLVFPFTDDQHRKHLFFRFPLSKNP